MESKIQYIVKKTSELTLNDENNFYRIFNEVYNQGEKIKKIFDKKYYSNIYGDSILVFAVLDEECIGIQAFLRNDLFDREAYQSGDSITVEKCRGMGVFTGMVENGIKKIPKDAIIYGFPNNNSLPVFKKMGWNIGNRKKYNLYFSKDKKKISEIEPEYIEWLLKDFCNLRYKKCGNTYFILKRRKLNLYQIIGKTSKNNLKGRIKRTFLPILIFYEEKGIVGNGMVPIWYGNKFGVEIPDYKIDTILAE